ncbi:hypothetical protein GYMLUDRAFT_208429 [Collybiopsis luxurians FD-317 M1]|uniref:DUF6534 domain-containing protein n=1 Tax=Collybiopsis luxurians FD-317 M1 TaxID=944289 RepID=A0A0D0BQ51_9AGAR|nr:hypothetical protein GYMLUDRAFT_208429 [Collybiopsis luxurians FD-317 M1]
MAGVASSTCPKLMGYIFAWILYGFLCSQAWTYYLSFPKDPARIKILVLHLLVVGTAQAAMSIHDAFVTFGTNFGDLDKLKAINTEWFYIPVLTVMASCPVQLFYARRIIMLSNTTYSKGIAIIVAMLSVFSFITSIINGARDFQNAFGSLYKDSFVFEQMWLISTAVCDVIITTTMVFLLKQSDPQVQQTRRLVSKLIRLLIESGFVTAAFAVADLGVFLAFPSYLYHIPICDGFANLHSLTLLVVLNYRSNLTMSTNSKATWGVAGNSLHFAHGDESTKPDRQSSEFNPVIFREMHWTTRSDLFPDTQESAV